MTYTVAEELKSYRDEINNEFQHWNGFAVK